MQQQNYCQLLLPKPWILIISPSGVNLVLRSHSVLQSQREVWVCCSPIIYSSIWMLCNTETIVLTKMKLDVIQHQETNLELDNEILQRTQPHHWMLEIRRVACSNLSLKKTTSWVKQHSFLKNQNNKDYERPVENQELLHTKSSLVLPTEMITSVSLEPTRRCERASSAKPGNR